MGVRCSVCRREFLAGDAEIQYLDWLKIFNFIHFMFLSGDITEEMRDEIWDALQTIKPDKKEVLET